MRRMTSKKFLCAGDDDLLRDLFFNVNRKGIALISSAFEDDDAKPCAPLTDAYLSQEFSYAPFRVHIYLEAFRRWYPNQMLRRRMIGLLNKSFCGAEDNDHAMGLYLESEQLPEYLEDHRFISLRAEEFEREWTRLGTDPSDEPCFVEWPRGWSYDAQWIQSRLKRTIAERDEKIRELEAQIAMLKQVPLTVSTSAE